MLLAIFILGEVFSILTILYIDYFGDPKQLFRKKFDDMFGLYMAAIFFGWITFPFFIYMLYKQIELDKNNHK